jgi:hypothetical protein
MSYGWDPSASDQPLPPQNGQVSSTFQPGTLDIRWDDPNLLAGNSVFTIVGVNIYRSDVSDRGPYVRINEFPVGGTFYRDQTQNIFLREVVDWNSAWISKGDSANNRRWTFHTLNPIVKKVAQAAYGQPTYADGPSDVTLYVDGVETAVEDVFGPNGEVTLINLPEFNPVTEKMDLALLPIGASTAVEIAYYTNRNFVRSERYGHLFYRLSTVVIDTTTPSGYRETPLTYCPPLSTVNVETMDYIWKEAVRRNHWILQQGGERVKVFIRKQSGIPCTCRLDDRRVEYSQQPSQRCLTCFGTGFVGGYEGPYDTIMAPDDAERRISQGPWGRRVEHTYEVWTGPFPLLTQRDFVVKQTNERYSIGPVRRPSNRGNLLQQHFNIASLDEQDIRYSVPIDGVDLLTWPQTRYGKPYYPLLPHDGAMPISPPYNNGEAPIQDPFPEGGEQQVPQETDKGNIPAERQQRGRSPAWENINYGILLIVLLPLMAEMLHAVSRVV